MSRGGRACRLGCPPGHPAAPARAIFSPEGALVVGPPAEVAAVRLLLRAPSSDPAPSPATLSLVVLGAGSSNARCRILGGEEEVTFRSGVASELVPGQIIEVRPSRDRTHRQGVRFLRAQVAAGRSWEDSVEG